MLSDLITRIRRAPRRAPCPHCGRLARRKRLLHRRVRTLAYHRVAWREVTYAEYRSRCGCCKYFRSWPLDVPPKADYDATVRQAVLDRLLHDRLNVEQTKAALRRDFLVTLSDGFVYDCLRWQLARLDLAAHRQLVLQRFSGTLCVDELHLGAYTLLLATDPLADLPVGFALVGANDSEHMGRFLGNLARWGLQPEVVVSDGSSLYPELLAQIWPHAQHQLCIFHLLRDVLDKVLEGVRRLQRAQARRGHAGRKRQRGRPSKKQQARRRQQGPTAKEKAAFVWKRRFLIVKRTAKLTQAEKEDLEKMFAYLPELRTVRSFSQDIYRLLDDSKTLRVARWRRTWLRYDPKYQEVEELLKALDVLAGPKLTKAMVFVGQPKGKQERTNNHVERMNRRLRFAEKVVTLATPSNVATNRKVVLDEFQLAYLLRERGAEVRAARTTPLANGRILTYGASEEGKTVIPPQTAREALEAAQNASKRAQERGRPWTKAARGKNKLEQAKAWVDAEGITQLTRDVIARGMKAGHSKGTLQRALQAKKTPV